jgi:Mor family transcriptional regulator
MKMDAKQTQDVFSELPAAAEALAEDTRWPRQLAAITDALAHELTQIATPFEPLRARRLACRLTARLARDLGGSWMYIAKVGALERVLRDQWLWDNYDGTVASVDALARHTGLTAIHVYRVLARQRERRRARPDRFE